MGVRRARGAKRTFLPAWKLGLWTKYFWKKTEVGILIPINWFDSYNDSFFCRYETHCTRARFTFTVSCSDELAVHSCPFFCLQRRVAKVARGLFYCWSLLRNNNMATNLQRFTSYYGGRRFVAWDCWTHKSWQVMQRDSDMLIAVNHVHLYFVKRCMSEFITMFP